MMKFSALTALTAATLTLAATGAHASPLLTYQNAPGCTMATACTAAPGIVGSTLTSNISSANWANGYITNDPWSVGNFVGHPLLNLGMTMTNNSGADVTLSDFAFSLFSNDCQVGNGPIPGCSLANFSITASIGSTTIGSIASFTTTSNGTTDFSLDLGNTALSSGQSLVFNVLQIDKGVNAVATGQYYFTNLSVNAPEVGVVPTPGTLALAGLGLAGLALNRRRFVR